MIYEFWLLIKTKIHKSPGHEQHEQKLVSYKQFSENLAHDMPKEHEFKCEFG